MTYNATLNIRLESKDGSKSASTKECDIVLKYATEIFFLLLCARDLTFLRGFEDDVLSRPFCFGSSFLFMFLDYCLCMLNIDTRVTTST